MPLAPDALAMNYQDIINFWFEEIEQKKWWVKDEAFDSSLKERFSEIYQKACRSELFDWREHPLGRLAEIIILDQFSRNMFRGKPESFAQDPLALALSQEAVRFGADKDMNSSQKLFLYMPHMHSESIPVHLKAQELFNQPGLEGNLDFEMKHFRIIERFGRYPHRNEILNRPSTPEEKEFLKEPGSSF